MSEKIAVICIGDELLKGAVVNTNLSSIGVRLLALGVVPVSSVEVPDRREDILAALEFSLARADIVITSGGLGPTADDVTKEYIAERCGMRLEEDGAAALNIMKHWKMRHPSEEIPPRVFNQALVPHGAKILQNDCGTAPGLIVRTPDTDEFPGRTIIMLPGPPNELCPMMDASVVPFLKKTLKHFTFTREFHVAGLGENIVEERMLPVIARFHSMLSVAYCATAQFVRLFLTTESPEVMESAIQSVQELFAAELLSDDADSLSHEILHLLGERDETLALAESCTGGLAAKLLTDIPGSSHVFAGGVVTYSDASKTSLLGVPADVIRKHGAVSAETARAMADGLANAIPSDAAIALTGIAGPGGATVGKPVGLVFAAIRYRGKTEVFELRLRRTREQIRERAVAGAFFRLRAMILAPENEA
jgi:nicotinamide-nucleotide amidase